MIAGQERRVHCVTLRPANRPIAVSGGRGRRAAEVKLTDVEYTDVGVGLLSVPVGPVLMLLPSVLVAKHEVYYRLKILHVQILADTVYLEFCLMRCKALVIYQIPNDLGVF